MTSHNPGKISVTTRNGNSSARCFLDCVCGLLFAD